MVSVLRRLCQRGRALANPGNDLSQNAAWKKGGGERVRGAVLHRLIDSNRSTGFLKVILSVTIICLFTEDNDALLYLMDPVATTVLLKKKNVLSWYIFP